jgi:hypothetical protein
MYKSIITTFLLFILLLTSGCKQSALQNQGKKGREESKSSAAKAVKAQDMAGSGLKLATFDVDATPPVGYQMAYNPVSRTWDLSLRARGIVLLGAGQPVVLLAVDWAGIYNDIQDEFKRALASAAGTIPSRVAVHTLHQHDAPVGNMQTDFVLGLIHRLEIAIRTSIDNAQPITHVGTGEAKVTKVASNRRILGADGKVRGVRFTATADPALRAEPEGLIDPMVSVVSFWNEDKPVAVLSFYATHPQSYYRTGIPNPDYPGIARFLRQLELPDALLIHFTGAGGNIGAGKYNDGSHINRGILARRLADGMKRAWDKTKRKSISASDIAWDSEPVALPPDTTKKDNADFIRRYKAGKKIDIGCLTAGNARILFMPGELFVEYQLAAKKMRPDLFVAMAAYGEEGPDYIPTDIAYQQGGYEPTQSNVLPGTEKILMDAMRKLLTAKP